MQPKKKTISIIMARLKPEDKGSKPGMSEMSERMMSEKSEEPSMSEDCPEDCVDAAHGILYALKKSDPKVLAQALLDFLEIAKSMDYKSESKEDEGEKGEDKEEY